MMTMSKKVRGERLRCRAGKVRGCFHSRWITARFGAIAIALIGAGALAGCNTDSERDPSVEPTTTTSAEPITEAPAPSESTVEPSASTAESTADPAKYNYYPAELEPLRQVTSIEDMQSLYDASNYDAMYLLPRQDRIVWSLYKCDGSNSWNEDSADSESTGIANAAETVFTGFPNSTAACATAVGDPTIQAGVYYYTTESSDSTVLATSVEKTLTSIENSGGNRQPAPMRYMDNGPMQQIKDRDGNTVDVMNVTLLDEDTNVETTRQYIRVRVIPLPEDQAKLQEVTGTDFNEQNPIIVYQQGYGAYGKESPDGDYPY